MPFTRSTVRRHHHLPLILAALLLVSVRPAIAQTAAVRGSTTEAANGEALQGVHLVLDDLGGNRFGSLSDRDGLFILTRIPPGRYEFRASFIGFETYVDTLDLAGGEQRLINIRLEAAEVELSEIAVEAERENGAARVTAGMQTVRPEEIELIPAPDISGDLVSYLSTMPGVVLMGDRGGQLFIRGGEPSHNLTLLDGMYVFQPFHILGFYSAFPSEIISQADVYAGGFGSKFTGRISSVIDVLSRNGDKRGHAGSVTLSPFTSSARLEGPLARDRISFLAAGRLSLLEQLASEYVSAPMPYAFGDAFGKVHAIITDHHQISISGLRTFDRGTMPSEDTIIRPNDEIRWSNTSVGARYIATPRSQPLLAEVLVSGSRLETELGPRDEPTRSSHLSSFNVALNMTNYVGRSQFNWGGFLREFDFSSELSGLFQNVVTTPDRSTNAGGYFEPDVYVGYGLRLRPGFSLQLYGTHGVFLEPRIRIVLNRGVHEWSGAGGLYRQDIIGLNDRRDATNIFTAWTDTPFGTASRAVHGLLGYRVAPFSWLDLSIEGFFKDLDDLFIGEWTAFPRFTTRLQSAAGQTAGFDVRLELRRRHVYGFVNYGYSSTRYETEPAGGVLGSFTFRPPHDRRHQINVLALTELYGFEVSARWQYGSGLPFTPVEGFDGFILMDGAVQVDQVPGFPRVIYESIPYRSELPTYHRLDLTIERTFSLSRRAELTMQVGVLNLYDRANLFALDLFTAQRTDQLPFVPVAGLRLDI